MGGEKNKNLKINRKLKETTLDSPVMTSCSGLLSMILASFLKFLTDQERLNYRTISKEKRKNKATEVDVKISQTHVKKILWQKKITIGVVMEIKESGQREEH